MSHHRHSQSQGSGQGNTYERSHHDQLKQFRQQRHERFTPAPTHTGHHVDAAHFDLAGAALEEMQEAGFHPAFGPDVEEQVQEIARMLADENTSAGFEDMRALGWSSIDNDTSRDLDQIEVAERVAGGIRLHIGVGDVATAVQKDSPIDKHAKDQTQTIYTAVRNFPMLPLELSTDMTSLNENGDRLAVVISFTVREDGSIADELVRRARVRNRAQLAYSRVGPWLERVAAGVKDDDVMALRSDSAREHDEAQLDSGALPANWLVEQLKLQDEATQWLHAARVAKGALEFHKAEADPVVVDGKVIDVQEATQNRAMLLIEDLMVAANGVMARTLRKGGRSGLQRVVVVPKRWDRIVALAKDKGYDLPVNPDSLALNNVLEQIRAKDADHYPDVALSVIKLMGPGEYILARPDDDPTGHFGLAARDYTHSTAPNRRFPDIVTQRALHALQDKAEPPYSDDELRAIAMHCNDADKALRKIERDMQKRVAAVAMAKRVGEVFHGVVTGATDKGVYVRVIRPPFEGRVVHGGEGLDVGDKVQVKLIHTDPERAFIDFAYVGK
ncbi:RNB domain-containing ribonuclease [Granulicella cerasi]|uniref:RNB domain-containing ribonuclease n=1 Tax=Granulicella cerasi TaxID=741063 RepID=A0ABW1Z8Y0_9BACT|nr:RNB domain-containing ribonuclease [Granulicella cerasi]